MSSEWRRDAPRFQFDQATREALDCSARMRSASVLFCSATARCRPGRLRRAQPCVNGAVAVRRAGAGSSRSRRRAAASIGEPGPSSAAVRRATSAATSLMRSRKSAFSTRSAAQSISASRCIFAISACSWSRSLDRGGELCLELGDLGLATCPQRRCCGCRRLPFRRADRSRSCARLRSRRAAARSRSRARRGAGPDRRGALPVPGHAC